MTEPLVPGYCACPSKHVVSGVCIRCSRKVRPVIHRTMTSEEYKDAENNFLGVCLACGEDAFGVEGDAEGYDCENCGEPRVQGIMNFMMSGMVTIDDSEDSEEE